MNGGYMVARENFKEAEKHVSAENDPVMFNLLFGLQSLTSQIEADLASLLARMPRPAAGKSKTGTKRKSSSKKAGKKKSRR